MGLLVGPQINVASQMCSTTMHGRQKNHLWCLQVLECIDETMPPETPLAFGLHPNAEIGFKLREAERFCANVLCLQPREVSPHPLSCEPAVNP